MPLELKSFQDFVNLISGKFKREIPTIDPTVKASLGRASAVSAAAAAFSNQEGIRDASRQMFWQTADDDFLRMIGEYDKTAEFEAQQSSGFANATGLLGEIIAQDKTLTFDGNTFIVTQDATIQEYSGAISLSYAGGIVTAATSLVHSLASGQSVVISGATQTEYNGTFDITALDENTFTYELTAGALTTDNGIYTAEYALLSLESQDTGSDQNVGSGGVLTIDQTDIDSDVFAGVDGISGGLDAEDIEDYRIRVGENHNITPGISAPPSMKASAKSIPGNTRVFIIRPDGTSGGTSGMGGYKPELGETVIYVLRDNDPSIIPSASQLQTTKDQILSDGHWPTWLPDQYLYVIAPTLVNQDFSFSSITPNTITMQNAIRDQLVSFFEDNADVGGTITSDQISAFLRQVQDPVTGDFLTNWTLTSPSGDIVSSDGEIYTVGDVTFS